MSTLEESIKQVNQQIKNVTWIKQKMWEASEKKNKEMEEKNVKTIEQAFEAGFRNTCYDTRNNCHVISSVIDSPQMAGFFNFVQQVSYKKTFELWKSAPGGYQSCHFSLILDYFLLLAKDKRK